MLLALGNESEGFKLGKKRKIMSSFVVQVHGFPCANLISCILPPPDLFLKLGLEDYISFGVEHNHWGS